MSEKLTYLQYNLKNDRIIRWPDNFFPLTFYIAPFRWYKGKGSEAVYYGMVTKALREWETASKGRCRFQLVNTLNESQINLDWKRVDRKSLGYCQFHFDATARLYSAEVQIGLSDGLLHAQYMDEKEVYHTILHEIGHSLGLGHSPYQNDIMYTPHQYGNITLSKRDCYSIQWLYNLPCSVSIKETANKYNLTDNNLDDIIMKIVGEKHESQFERVKNSIQIPQKDLMQEQSKLGEIKKYQVFGLQNVQLPKISQDFFRKQQQNNKKDNK